VPLENVPPYLIRILFLTDPERLRELVAAGAEWLEPQDLRTVADALDTWLADDEFWDMASEYLESQEPVDLAFEEFFEREYEILTAGLGGDERLAALILLEAPLRVYRANPERAREAVARLNAQFRQAVEQSPSRARTWRVARVLRRLFKAAGGGVLVAADIVVPDPTLIVQTASITGGIDMIIDAAGFD